MSHKKLFVLIFTLLALAAVPAMSFAQAQGRGGAAGQGSGRGGGSGSGQRGAVPPAPITIKQVKPGLYMVINGGGNSTVRVTDQGVVVVDTKNLGDQFYNDLMAQIKTVTTQPVKFAVVTHVHQDHAGNIERFQKAGVPVIANAGLNQNLKVGGPNGKGYEAAQGKPAEANTPYTKTRKIKLGKAQVLVAHFDAGHTAGDSVVYFPDEKVVSLGDEFTAIGPNCDYPMGGSILGWAKSLQQVLKWDFDTAIPGHGNDPMTKADVITFQKRMDEIGKTAITLVKTGTPKDQLRQQIQMKLGPDMGNWQMTGVVNDMRLDMFYDEISKAAKSAKSSD